ncbi:MAG TPA: RNA polymerase sigma factor [Pyrinomonadaceae bacterium]|nr:RNA polymerase sigma factor [Pyrinomonadaceae bacterium]
MSDSPSDLELLRRMQGGDEDAFVALYRRRQGGVYRFALQMCGSEAVAEDVTQEVFMSLMQDGCKFDPERGSSLAAYLYGMARNQVLRVFQRDRAHVPIRDEGEEGTSGCSFENLVAPGDLLADLTRVETIEKVRQAVLALPPHYREVVALCELHEMSYAEAAEALGCAVGTVRSRLHRARAMLIDKLGTTGGAREELPRAAEGFKTARCFA